MDIDALEPDALRRYARDLMHENEALRAALRAPKRSPFAQVIGGLVDGLTREEKDILTRLFAHIRDVPTDRHVYAEDP
jgi:hypothetical protein